MELPACSGKGFSWTRISTWCLACRVYHSGSFEQGILGAAVGVQRTSRKGDFHNLRAFLGLRWQAARLDLRRPGSLMQCLVRRLCGVRFWSMSCEELALGATYMVGRRGPNLQRGWLVQRAICCNFVLRIQMAEIEGFLCNQKEIEFQVLICLQLSAFLDHI